MDARIKKVKTTRPSNDVLKKIGERDKDCVYCSKKMIFPWSKSNIADSAEIEHLNHKKDLDSVGSYMREGKDVSTIVAYCCHTCNLDRRDQSLLEWFKTSYCKEGKNCMRKKINENTVAEVVKKYIERNER